MKNRYNRHIILSEIGISGQEAISSSKVLVIGAGGLGCPVLQYLVAAGVGKVGIVDNDIVDESNLQRQVLYGTSSLGISKSIAAKERLEDLNSDIEIISYPIYLNKENAIDLFSGYDIIVDGSDNFSTRYLVSDASLLLNKPLVYGSIYKFDGQVSVFNYRNGPSYRCLFPKPPLEGMHQSCSEVGVLGILPGIIGSMQANEVLKIILGIGEVLSGKILIYNTLDSSSYTIELEANPKEKSKILDSKNGVKDLDYDFSCKLDSEKIIKMEEISNPKNYNWIDVREDGEGSEIGLGEIRVAMSEIENFNINIDKSKATVVFCQKGLKSKTAVKILEEKGIKNLYSLKDGLPTMHIEDITN